MVKTAGFGPKKFQFRDLPQKTLIGKASDRYAGWIGQIYSEGWYEKLGTGSGHGKSLIWHWIM
jgi:hypothetical protein